MLFSFPQRLMGPLFNFNYQLIEKLYRWTALIGIPFELAFQIVEMYGGYYTPWSFRILAVGFLIVMGLFPKNFTLIHKVGFETGIGYVLGIYMCFFYLTNGNELYAVASWVLCGFFLGFLTQPVLVIPHWIASITIGTMLAYFFNHGSFVPFSQAFKFHVPTLWLMVSACGIRLLFEKFMSIQKDLELTKHTNSILKWRNETISIFIRPSILKEIESGFNPLEFKPRLREKTVMVCDLRNFSGLSNEFSGNEIHELMNQYFETILDPIYENSGEVDKLSGDGIIATFDSPLTAIKAGVSMRRNLQDLNRIRINRGQSKLRNVITLASGKATEANYGKLNRKMDRTIIGKPINLASRMEAVAKAFDTEILASESVVNNCGNYQFARMVDRIRVKGLESTFYVYEIFEHQAENVINYKKSTRSLIEKGLRIYFENKGLKDAYRIFKALEGKMPSHNYHSKMKMDPIIGFHLYRLQQWIGEPERWDKLVEDWIACDDFEFDAPPTDWMVIPRS